MLKFSIVIPTYNHCEDLLMPCLDSIKKYSNLQDIEVIVVANGCTDGTKSYVESLGEPFKLVWLDEPSGYTKSTNEGIKVATGQYTILMNNDTEVLEQTRNEWLDQLEAPFKADSKVGASGPMLVFSDHAKRDFLIGFCLCTPTELIKKVGMLDEIFSPGYGEDVDYCCRLQDLGYRVVSICTKTSYSSPNRMEGDFRFYHKGNITFANWPGGNDLLKRNWKILEERYANKPVPEQKGEVRMDISKALKTDGYMADSELLWLANEAQKRKVIIEIGSWHGRSSRAMADNLMPGGVLYCVDTWNGSAPEQQTWHASAKMREGDHAMYEFLQGNFDNVQSGKIIPIRMSSRNASDFFREKGIKADMIFIDAEHTYEAVKHDIQCWKDLLAPGGIMCGHDIGAWEGVAPALQEMLNCFYVGDNTTIWYCSGSDIKPDRPYVFDCFTFNNEFEILDRRFQTLFDHVDRFVIVEATRTHGGKPKPLNFNDNLKRYEKYLSKVTYIVVGEGEYPVDVNKDPVDSWAIERFQRDAIMRGLTQCKESDTIIVTDCDEIPDPEAIKKFHSEDKIRSLEMELYYFNDNTKADDPWFEGKILTYGELRRLSPCGARYTADAPRIPNAGKHLSYFYFGDINRVIKKIEDTAHQEYNKLAYKDPAVLAKHIALGEDVFGRDLKYRRTFEGQDVEGVLKGYDIDGVLTSGVTPEAPYVVISGRTNEEYDDFAKEAAKKAPLYIRGVGKRGDTAAAGMFKAQMINALGVKEFYEDESAQAKIIEAHAPNCKVIMVPQVVK